MAKRYWLLKCEPEAYTIGDLKRDGVTSWEGVRNYQARNYMRDDMKPGDGVLFYASNADPSGVSGLAEIAREGYPDHFAFDPKHDYHDAKSDPESPTWFMVDIRFVDSFDTIVPLASLKATPGLEAMMVTQKGSRLSVQPVTKQEFEIVASLGRKGARASAKKTK
ncbi:MAG: EVE domain-containing protein [Acidobacteria bacterium]|nr:EVE domain-containing protein [Acidobacteriota bacterium]